jgi:hypothetical protein
MEKKLMSVEEYNQFNAQMAWLKTIKYEGYAKTLQKLHISYLGSVNVSAKLKHNYSVKVHTYGLYLASADLSGFNVCGAYCKNCKDACLSGSGHAKIDALAGNHGVEFSRILKTRLFFANRPVFLKLMEHEIIRAKKRAEKLGYVFSIRVNCTSDLNLNLFKFEDGKNILEKFSDVQFYDYTKSPNKLKMVQDYSNYSLTFSRDGSKENEKICLDWLSKGGNVAVVFGTTKASELPKTWNGYPVINGDLTDYRPSDPSGSVVGLTYKVTGRDFSRKNGKNTFNGIPDIPFIVKVDSAECGYC